MLGRVLRWAGLLVLAGLVIAAAAFAVARWTTRGDIVLAAAEPGSAERGQYIFHAADCVSCHTVDSPTATPLAGGRELDTPFGRFYGPNITPDPVHGIGGWSDADFVRALRQGVAPDGSDYYPAFPYPSFTGMTDQDLLDLKAYLFAQPPVAEPDRPHELAFPFNLRPLVTFWKALFLEPGPLAPDPAQPEPWNRGAYLVRALAHCSECHTPRNALGAPDTAMFLAGTQDGPEGRAAPNITPDPETGIGSWAQADLAFLLQTGMTPEGDFVGGQMNEVVQHGTSKLTPEDRAAIAAYIFALPPIRNQVARPERSGGGADDFL